jgi:hypothetical protein
MLIWKRIGKVINGEIAFGFFCSALFWLAVLGWATSYAPNPEKEKACYQAAAKTGHNTEQCKTLWERTSPTRRFVRAEIRANSREVFLGSLPAFWKLRVLSYLITKYFFFKIQAGFLKSSLEVQKVKNDLYC